MGMSANKMSDWQLPQRQSPAAVFGILGKIILQLLKFFWPVLVLYFMKNERDESSFYVFWSIAGFGLLSLAGTFISYWFRKFYIRDNQLIVQSGWLQKKNLSIPFQNIQAVHLEQNVWQQAFGVTKVSFDATGSEKVEVQLDALETGKARELKNLLMGDAQEKEDPEAEPEKERKHTYRLGFADLLKLSLTANHLEALLILLAFSYNITREIKRIFDFDEQEYMETYALESLSQTAYIVFALLFTVAIISLLFSIVRTIIKFFDFSLTDNRLSWKIAYGLFNRQQKSIPLNKIQIISWRASWLRRKFDYWIILVQSVGHSKQAKKQHVQIPVLDFSGVVNLAGSYQKFTGIDPEKSNPIKPDYWKRKALLTGLPLAVIPVLASWYWIEWWALGFSLLFLYVAGHYYIAWKNFRWETVPSGLQVLSGAWGRKYTLLKWSKIQQVHIHQSPYQRRNGLANIIFLTAGGRVVLPYLSLSSATELVDMVLYEVESKNEAWM